jgi:hypothetical protein
MNTRLAEHIAGIPDMAGLSFRQVLHVAQMLIDLTSRAAAHQCEPLLLDYRALLGDVEMESARAVIEGKRIDADRLRSLLEQERQPAALLRPVAPAAIRGLAAGSRVLELKAARGGFTSDNIDLLRDQKYAAESLFIGWLSKYDANRALALERYNHLLMLVRNECQEAYDAAQATAPGGGPRMLESVRRRLRERHAAGRDELFGCTYEHLLGVAGILTEECAVWWSEHFPIEEETGE